MCCRQCVSRDRLFMLRSCRTRLQEELLAAKGARVLVIAKSMLQAYNAQRTIQDGEWDILVLDQVWHPRFLSFCHCSVLNSSCCSESRHLLVEQNHAIQISELGLANTELLRLCAGAAWRLILSDSDCRDTLTQYTCCNKILWSSHQLDDNECRKLLQECFLRRKWTDVMLGSS